MANSHAVYTREHIGHGWRLELVTSLEVATLARDVNSGFGVQTLVVPTAGLSVIPRALDSYQSQEDFGGML